MIPEMICMGHLLTTTDQNEVPPMSGESTDLLLDVKLTERLRVISQAVKSQRKLRLERQGG